MKSFSRFREHPLLAICLIAIVALFSVGCKSSRSDSGATTNPLAAYEVSNSGVNSATGNVIGDGSTIVPGSLNSPVISVPEEGSTSISGHDNAPLLDNKHPGWQQSNCLTCHNDTTNNPDHSYNDDSLCYLCHGTNGLPGISDSVPPVLSGVVVSPTDSSVTISWKSDEDCTSRLVIKTTEGDKMEFPVSTSYSSSHKKTVTGLQSSTTYYYELVCVDKSGNKTSSSSFSSVLSFQTLAKTVTPVVTTETESGGTNDSELDETSGYFKTVKVQSDGMNVAKIDFETLATPAARHFYWYIFPSRVEARKKSNGQRVAWDDMLPRAGNKYSTETDPLSGIDNKKEYFLRIGVVFEGSADSKWSSIYAFKFKN